MLARYGSTIAFVVLAVIAVLFLITGHWILARGQVPEGALRDVPREFPAADLDRWSMTTDGPLGRLRHLGPVVRLSETPPQWSRPVVPLGYNEPAWPSHAA